jgi:ubiquinone/menaquinone biosynthesis C-methylase UbiE
MIPREPHCIAPALTPVAATADSLAVAIPQYLDEVYWWAYVHPNAVRVFERQWLVNLILWGNFKRLRDAALDALGAVIAGRTLQIACVYGDLTLRLAERITGTLDVADVLQVQLRNLCGKLPASAPVTLLHRDSTALGMGGGSYDQALLFFLLHEQPEVVRRATLAEAMRVVKPGGRIVIVDYHRPHALSPFNWLFGPLLRQLEPFAMDLWRDEICSWLPAGFTPAAIHQCMYFGGLYQKVVITV